MLFNFVLPPDLLYAMSINGDESRVSGSIRLTLKCFSGSFAGIAGDSACLCDLPDCNKPSDGFGILMNLNGSRRWQTFTTWMIKLLSKCISDGMIFVEGLLSLSFVSSTCSLLCYGDADLQMVGSTHFLILREKLCLFCIYIVNDFFLFRHVWTLLASSHPQ